MEYELAKQLKDAGWPQNRHDGNWAWPKQSDPTLTAAQERCAIPNLEELVDACGDNLGSLNNMPTGWTAFYRSSQKFYDGSTPTEAVARLWLWLPVNSKKA
jgi:hypothetical protein